MIRIRVLRGDISECRVDAVVNAANNHLWMGSGVAGALRRRGGPEIEDEAVSKGPVDVGDAVETTAGNLNARYVIHGAVMGQDLMTDTNIIERTTMSCLEVAQKLGISSIAFPAFGCGVGGMDPRKVAEAMKRAFRRFDRQTDLDIEISLVLFDPITHGIFLDHFHNDLP
jgi:O-acetyl-ADP-ribose deacetylase (regulator of RNase III)